MVRQPTQYNFMKSYYIKTKKCFTKKRSIITSTIEKRPFFVRKLNKYINVDKYYLICIQYYSSSQLNLFQQFQQ